MVKSLKVSNKKILAFFLAVAVALLTIGGVLPLVAKAEDKISNVDITIRYMPEVGGSVSDVTENNDINIFTQGGSELEDFDQVKIKIYEFAQLDEMDRDAKFEINGNYVIFVSLSDADTQKIGSPTVTINGANAFWNDNVKQFQFYFNFATATFNSDGGSVVEPQTFIQGFCIAEPIDPTKSGYEFLAWLDEDGNVFDFDNPVSSDITLTAKWAKDCNIISGDNQNYYLESGDDFVIKIDANYTDLYDIYLIGNTSGKLIAPDVEDYTVTEGSTVVTFKNSFLKTLAADTYDLIFMFSDSEGNESVAHATLTVNDGVAPSTSPATPATGDDSNIVAFIAMGFVAVAGIVSTVVIKRKVAE
ncbi:MAG: hypothetical protein E7242_11650 [Lachnospiraceae bacterium]|nr:hypothetical protein [Lachnospiraceae bacterium]